MDNRGGAGSGNSGPREADELHLSAASSVVSETPGTVAMSFGDLSSLWRNLVRIWRLRLLPLFCLGLAYEPEALSRNEFLVQWLIRPLAELIGGLKALIGLQAEHYKIGLPIWPVRLKDLAELRVLLRRGNRHEHQTET